MRRGSTANDGTGGWWFGCIGLGSRRGGVSGRRSSNLKTNGSRARGGGGGRRDPRGRGSCCPRRGGGSSLGGSRRGSGNGHVGRVEEVEEVEGRRMEEGCK